MNRLLTTLTSVILMVAGSLTSSAQLSRSEGLAEGSKLKSDASRMCVAPELMRKARVSEKATPSQLKTVSRNVTAPKRTNRGQAIIKSVGSAKVTGVQGFISYVDDMTKDPGWYNLTLSQPTMIWKRPIDVITTGGFVRDGQVWSFAYSMNSSGSILEAGYYITDLNTGNLISSTAYDIYDSYEQCVNAMTYDPKSDTAYAITYNKTGKSYLFQKYDPKTDSFTNLGVNPGADWLALGWNPADQSVYLLTETGTLKRYDSYSMKFVYVTAYSYDMTEYPNAMVYSPQDNAFLAMIDSWYESEYIGDVYTTDAVLLSLNGTLKYLGSTANNDQWRILYTADEYVNPEGVSAPTVKSWNVADPALNGSLTVTLPSTLANGSTVTGTIYLDVTLDNAPLSGTFRGAAGADVEIPLNVSEGLHTVAVTPYTLGDDGKVYGTALTTRHYFGHDTPSAPANVKLTETKVTWSAVTTGINAGYIDAANVTYNVSIDGVKMNDTPITGTSLDIVIPESATVAHRAEVTAQVDGKVSDPGVSGKYYGDGALNLPVTIKPEEGETDLDPEVIGMFTSVRNTLNTEALRGWRYDDQSEKTGGFYCLCPKASDKGDVANEYLFLPAVNFPDKDAYYRLSVDLWSANHYFTTDEDYEIVLAQRPSGSRAMVIREKSTIYKSKDFELSETLFQVPEAGEWYIGIHYISPIGSYRLYARNFRIEKVDAAAESPSEVTSLTATPHERGELKATVTFSMPTLDISGNLLDEATVITAKAVTEEGEVAVDGAPGQKMTVEVPTHQGDNLIQVITSAGNLLGRTAEATVYCGVYAPSSPIVGMTTSDDNQHLTLDILIDDYNEKGQFAGPDDCLATIYRKIDDRWGILAEIGTNRTWTFDCPNPNTQDTYLLAVGVKNAAGSCEYLTSLGVNLGKLYTLPMKETYPTSGNNIDMLEPVRIEHISELPVSWGFIDPSDLDTSYGNESGIALAATWAGESQIVLPRFSTLGLENVKFDFSTFFGNLTPQYITVYATSPKIEMEPIGMFTRTDGTGWENKLLTLPAKCQNQPWVEIIVRVKLDTYSQYFMMDSYSIANYPDQMATITAMNGPSRAVVGEPLTYEVEIENSGVGQMQIPDYTFNILGSNGVVATDLEATDAPASVDAGKRCKLHFTITPKSAHIGNLVARFSMSGQPASAVTEAEMQTRLINAPVPVVSDLTATYKASDKSVTLDWSTPKFIESFEAFEPWAYDEEMRGFRNIDLDGNKVWSISEINYTGKNFAKAYQVFTGEITANPYLQAHSGTQYLAVMSATSGASNDWLISPQVKGGSELSFWFNLLSADYPETLLVKYSSTGNDVNDFRDLPDGYICPDDAGWTKQTVQLPADAKYFALHHVGDDGAQQFGFFIDDIAYVPAEDPAPIQGYNVYRNDELVGANLTEAKYVDTDVDLSMPVKYFVKTISTVNNEKLESDRSNVVWMEDQGEDGVDAINAASGQIYAVNGHAVIKGYAAGTTYTIANMQGMTIAEGTIAADAETVALHTGYYIVSCGGDAVKLLVK